MDTDTEIRDVLGGLIVPLDSPVPRFAERSAEMAGRIGHAFGRELRACILCLVREGRPLSADPRGYLTFIVDPWWRECGFEEGVVRWWDEAFRDGSALEDPRVRAFCAGLTEEARQIADEVARKRSVLMRYVEADAAEIRHSGLRPSPRTVFAFRSQRYLVLTADEAAGGLPHPGSAGPASTLVEASRCAAAAEGACPLLAVNHFLDHVIVQWHERDGEPVRATAGDW